MYKTVYDLTNHEVSYTNGWLLVVLLFMIIGIGILFIRKLLPNSDINNPKAFIIGIAMVFISSTLLSIILIPQFLGPNRARKIMREGRFLVVEGRPENYHPMPAEGHDEQSFDIQGVHFHYSDYNPRFGYDNAASLGGVISPDNYYRITYFPDQDSTESGGHSIIKIELRQ
jgi:hypothetical protein